MSCCEWLNNTPNTNDCWLRDEKAMVMENYLRKNCVKANDMVSANFTAMIITQDFYKEKEIENRPI